ncbi:DUF5067 domain-containing protein [Microbacterium testaceum]|uniref:DUF5067 domain-containing protein n=1 Tax=Microbacterium testaceum TaxID=2033 RepID=UPI0022E31E7F|nr:DUF5067 domain-containing protein [Microbacterium testaceum]
MHHYILGDLMRRFSTLVTFIATAGIAAFALTGCSGGDAAQPAAAEQTTAVDSTAIQDAPDAATFVDNVLTAEDVTITITDTKTIAAGEPGNEYGDAPVIAFWYDITNKQSAREVTPNDFLFYFNAFQDNDPNVLNELQVAGLPDDQFLESQMAKIKEGGTASNAVAYTLSDTTTPVDLVASTDFGQTEIGKATFTLN